MLCKIDLQEAVVAISVHHICKYKLFMSSNYPLVITVASGAIVVG